MINCKLSGNNKLVEFVKSDNYENDYQAVQLEKFYFELLRISRFLCCFCFMNAKEMERQI